MSGFHDQVSVFHFTNRISSAKIKKYKLATERGMGPNGQRPSSSSQLSNGPIVTPAPQVEPAGLLRLPTASSASSPAESDEPPTKRPKLAISARSASPSMPTASSAPTPGPPPSLPTPRLVPVDDNITVANPRRHSALRIRYSENMQLEDETLRKASAESSGRSSATLTPPPAPAQELTQRERNSTNLEYGDFMNYYVLDGDEDSEPKEPAPVKSSKPKQGKRQEQRPSPSSQRQHQNPHSHPHPHPHPHQPSQTRGSLAPQRRNDTKLENHPHRSAPPLQNPPPPRTVPPQPPLPRIELIGFNDINKSKEPKEPRPVREMVQRLEALSTSLVHIGGVPAGPNSPKSQPPEQPSKQPNVETKKTSSKKGDALDTLLDMFEDDAEDTDEERSEESQNAQQVEERREKELNCPLEHPGEPDWPLTYGIQFIQNALKSWAQQKLTHQMQPQLQQQAQLWAQQQVHSKKRGPGRPRKFTDANEQERAEPPVQPPPIQMKADSTPEGIAVMAFQQVLDSGCLQMNTILPFELTRALKRLYMQIDRLINQGTKGEPQWVCMSYGAQIAANKARVERWKEAQAKAHEEMARQQQLAQQQVMQQMGLPVRSSPQLLSARTAHQQAVELEQRRSQQYAQHQPYLSHHHLNPLSLGSEPRTTPVGVSPSPSLANAQRQQSELQTRASKSSLPVNGNLQHMDKVKMYMPGYMPRSGTQMKFSFTPTNEDALKVFGSQAFPTPAPAQANIPNRERMDTSQPSKSPSAPTNSGPPASPAIGSIDTGHVPGQSNRHTHHATKRTATADGKRFRTESHVNERVKMNDASGGHRHSAPVQIKKGVQSTPAPPQIAAPQTGGFTAVNAAPQQHFISVFSD